MVLILKIFNFISVILLLLIIGISIWLLTIEWGWIIIIQSIFFGVVFYFILKIIMFFGAIFPFIAATVIDKGYVFISSLFIFLGELYISIVLSGFVLVFVKLYTGIYNWLPRTGIIILSLIVIHSISSYAARKDLKTGNELSTISAITLAISSFFSLGLYLLIGLSSYHTKIIFAAIMTVGLIIKSIYILSPINERYI